MFYLRMYELIELAVGHELTYELAWTSPWSCGPGFLNAVNRYYGYQVWR